MKTPLRILLVFSLVWSLSRSAIYFLPGDPADFLVHESLVQVTPEDLRSKMDLDRGIIHRVFSLPKNESLIQKQSTTTLVGRAFFKSVTLTLLTLAFSLPATLGLLYLHFQSGRRRSLSHAISIFIASTPLFVAGPLLLRCFQFPNPILPALTLSLYLTGFWYRSLSKKLDALLPESSVPGARALGFPEFQVFSRNLLAPALGSFLAYFGTQLGILFNGSLIVETIFQWNGLGSLLAESVLSRDYPVIEVCLLVVTLLTLLSQQIGYWLQSLWEPRLR